MKIVSISREDWLEKYARMAHISVFGESNEELLKNSLFDQAFMVMDEKECPIIYTTIKQTSAKSVFIEFGGSFPDYRGSTKVKPAFKQLCNFLQEAGAEFISLSIKTDNAAMQKLALHVGFLPFGMNVTEKGAFIDYALTKEEK